MGDFGGVIGPTWRESTPWWPPEPEAPEGAPNVVVVVLDDVGYAQLGCYGSDIETPHLDGLAAGGVRLSRFHTTSLCSPTRACLLTGRNHHSVGMGRVADLAVGYPGYWGRIDRSNGFLSEILAANGYVPQAVGKWHLTPEDETHMAAPRDTWPCGRGFQRWYGFHGGETHQFVPSLFEDNHSVVPPRAPADGYHLSEDLADRAIRYLGDIRSVTDKPFFLYFATGACHSPHHAPAEWIDRYRGRFDGGWDAWREATFARQQQLGLLASGARLSPRPHWVPAWDSLGAEDQAVAARFMECFAGFLSHADAQIGRVLAFLDELGEADDTIVVALSDNGASAEGGATGSINDARLWNGSPAGRRELRARIDELGGPTAHNNYPWGWTLAGNTPFRRWKREVHEGGIADPCIVRWPRGIAARGAVRHQMTHAIDVLPTILELIGVSAPDELGGIAQRPIEGTSFAYLLGDDADAPERHTTQHFEMLGSRGIYHEGWKAVTFKPLAPMYDDGLDPDAPFDEDVWELYDVRTDPTECDDVAAQHPEKLAELVALWWDEARRHHVLPLDNRPVAALLAPRRAPDQRERLTYWPGAAIVPETVAVNVRNRPHTITAVVDGAADGTILAMGTTLGGWALQVHGGCLRYVHNHLGRTRTVVAATEPLAPGRHEVVCALSTPGDLTATAVLLVDGAEVARGAIPQVTAVRYSITGGGVTCGWEQGPAIGDDYTAPFPYAGVLGPVTVAVLGPEHHDPEALLASILAEQ